MDDEPYLIGSVSKALLVLEMLRDDAPLGVQEIGTRLGVARSTAHRLVSTLRAHGFVAQDPGTRAYLLGPFLTGLGIESPALQRLREIAMPHIGALSAQLQETAHLTVLAGNACRFVAGVSGDRPLKTSVRVGSELPAHATSGGKVLLAELPDSQLRTLASSSLDRLTDRSITDVNRLLRQLRQVRKNGYAVNEGESENGITAVAVPIRNPAGTAVAAIAVSLPSIRVVEHGLPALVAAALRTSAQIGAGLY
jgi:DNA-binding IclR family transcriptional regulator